MKAIILGVLLLFPLNLGFSQSETGRAVIAGSVSDPDNNFISGAGVTIRETQTGLERKLQTDTNGQFRAAALPVGTYTVEAVAAGFGVARIGNLTLAVGETKNVNIALRLASVETEVLVVEAADLIDRSDPSNSININSRAIADLPIRGRNFTEFVQLSPNVTQESNRFGIVVNGQRSINSNIAIDGVDFNDPLQGGPRGGGPNESAFFFPQLAVREFQFVLNGASAEVGRTNAGYLNVVTQSGTNNFHGAGFYQNRNSALTSPDAFGNDSSSNSQHEFGASLGGPIRNDKLFFFAAAEKNLVNIPYTVKFSKPSGNVVVPQDILSQQGEFNQKNNPLVGFGRLDYRLNQKNTINFQYTYAAQSGLNFGGVSGQMNAASTNNTILDRASQGVKGALTTVFGPSLVSEFRGQWVYDNRIQQPVSPLAQVDINDFGTLGGSSNGTYIYDATRVQFLDNISWTRGIHSIKFGVDLNIEPERQQRETTYGGLYSFNTLAEYLTALAGDKTKIGRYQQTIAADGRQGLYDKIQQDHALFFTDTMRVAKSLTVTAGLRWEGQINPHPPFNKQWPINSQIPNDFRMWQPRFGIAYDLGGKGRTVLRLSGGLFDARTPGYLMQRVFTDNGLSTVVLDSSVDSRVLNYLTIPSPIATLPAELRVAGNNAIYAFDSSFRNPRSGQVCASVEQRLDKDTTVTLGFVRNATWALQRRLDINLFQPIVLSNGFVAYPVPDAQGNPVQASRYDPATGQGVYVDSTGRTLRVSAVRPDPTAGQINVNKSIGYSSYNGGYISVQRRMSHRVQFGLNYTYSVNHDDDSNERDFNRQYEINVYNLKSDAANAKNDIRHRFNTNVLFDIGHGFTLSGLLMARPGMPGRYVIGTDLSNDGNKYDDRPVINGHLVPRDSTRLPGFFDWDMRLLKEFRTSERTRLMFSIEGYNLTRASNKTFTSDGYSTFGKPTTTVNPATGLFYTGTTAGIPTFAPGTDRFGGPRQVQFGLRFIF